MFATKSLRVIAAAFVVALSLASSLASAAAFDYFLKIDGIEGESTEAGHVGEMDIYAYSWGVTNAGSSAHGGGGGAGKASFSDLHFSSSVGKSSPKLMLSCATGQHIKEAKLTCRKTGGDQQEYFVIKLSDCLVSSYQSSGSSGDVVPTDQFSLNFAKIEFEYFFTDSRGTASSVKAGYDLKANKKI